jgi:hypothetical protein
VKFAAARIAPPVMLLAMVSLTGVSNAQQSPPGVGENAKLSADFESRATRYLNLRKQVAGKSSGKSDSPQEIAANQKLLAERIKSGRPNARQGEIFTPELTAFFRRQIKATLRGPKSAEIRASLQHAEPVNMKLAVNQTYPEKVPLQSTPPSLLLNLPAAPDGLEYRIVGSDLVLRDTEANIVVDFIPELIPAS